MSYASCLAVVVRDHAEANGISLAGFLDTDQPLTVGELVRVADLLDTTPGRLLRQAEALQ